MSYPATSDQARKIQQTHGKGYGWLFDVLPAQLRNFIKEKGWMNCQDKHGKRFASFEAFVVHRLPQGLESSIADLEFFCRKQPDVLMLIEKAKNGEN